MSDFSRVVADNADWLFRFVRTLTKSDHAAEEVVQETFFRAYKNYSGYTNQGKERAWLKTIARNVAYRYYNLGKRMVFLSLDGEDSGDLADILPDYAPQPEEQIIRDEFVAQLLSLVDKLPERQRMIVTYRYLNNLSIEETAQSMGLPKNTVKSNAHYGLSSLRKQLGITPDQTKKGASSMKKQLECMNFYGELFQYAKGYLDSELRGAIEQHTKDCSQCENIVGALKAIMPYLETELDGDEHDNYYFINFMTAHGCLAFTGYSNIFSPEQVKYYNDMFEKSGGKITDENGFINNGQDADSKKLSSYTNDGGKVEFEVVESDRFPNHVRIIQKTMPKVSPVHWTHGVNLRVSEHGHVIRQSKEAPNLFNGYAANNLGKASKCGIFIPLPDDANNIRIKKGSGVLELEGYKFAYSQRFTAEYERMELEFTFNK